MGSVFRMARRGEQVPSQPFIDWLARRHKAHLEAARAFSPELSDSVLHGMAVTALAREVGWDYDAGRRRLYRFRHGVADTKRGPAGAREAVTFKTDVFPRASVEDALWHANVPFEALYPEIAAREDWPVAPEVWCPGCQEDSFAAPDGLCPWCGWRLVVQERVCACGCGEPFAPRTPVQVYASRECKRGADHRRRQERKRLAA